MNSEAARICAKESWLAIPRASDAALNDSIAFRRFITENDRITIIIATTMSSSINENPRVELGLGEVFFNVCLRFLY